MKILGILWSISFYYYLTLTPTKTYKHPPIINYSQSSSTNQTTTDLDIFMAISKKDSPCTT